MIETSTVDPREGGKGEVMVMSNAKMQGTKTFTESSPDSSETFLSITHKNECNIIYWPKYY
jgi:hypothetical protein